MGFFSSKPITCHKSGEVIDKETAGRYALIPFDKSNPDNKAANEITKKSEAYSYSKESFQDVSTLDFSRTYDVVEPAEGTTASGVAFVLVHGGGGSRAMFRPHAELLSQRGHRCVLLDLPGHGTLVDTPLTLDSCAETVKSVLEKETASAKKTIYVGGSFGAYTGFYTLDKLADKFDGAVMIDCGQNVGPDCSLKARLGLWVMGAVTKNMSNKSMVDAMLGVTVKSPADWKLVESCFGAGTFFDQARAQVDCIHSVQPADHIPNLKFPMIYFNGSLDYRDSENKWLSLCQDQTNSYLHVYEGGDHFFTHDSRFAEDLIKRMDEFGKVLEGL